MQFVKAGMNDIDVRCDAYLAWLDNRRRSAEPLLRQIGDMGKATGSILDATGVGPHPMNIVGIAFGMAANTFTNVNSRLLLEVNQATVQSVVHKGQEEFRYRKDYTNTFNRSDAIYHLRSYLRLCMPFTIETDINTTVAIVKRVGPQSLENNPLIAPETDAPELSVSSRPPPMATASTQTQEPRTPNQKPVAKSRPLPKGDAALAQIFKDYSPREFPPSTVEKIYKVLCVPRTERARVGEIERKHVEIWEQTETAPVTVDGLVDKQERDLLIGKSDCPIASVRNYYERQRFRDGAETDVADVIDLLNRLPDDKLPGRGLLPHKPGAQRSEDAGTHSPGQKGPRHGSRTRRQALERAREHGRSMDAGLGRRVAQAARAATGQRPEVSANGHAGATTRGTPGACAMSPVAPSK